MTARPGILSSLGRPNLKHQQRPGGIEPPGCLLNQAVPRPHQADLQRFVVAACEWEIDSDKTGDAQLLLIIRLFRAVVTGRGCAAAKRDGEALSKEPMRDILWVLK